MAEDHVQSKAGKWMLRASGEASAEEQQSQLLDSIVSHIPNMNFLATSHSLYESHHVHCVYSPNTASTF